MVESFVAFEQDDKISPLIETTITVTPYSSSRDALSTLMISDCSLRDAKRLA